MHNNFDGGFEDNVGDCILTTSTWKWLERSSGGSFLPTDLGGPEACWTIRLHTSVGGAYLMI